MKNKVVIIFIALFLSFIILLVGCTETTTLNVNMEGEVTSTQSTGFIDICDYPIPLVYDEMTRIIYVENRTYGPFYVYTPYYAPNGLPYKYNPETNTFEEIEE